MPIWAVWEILNVRPHGDAMKRRLRSSGNYKNKKESSYSFADISDTVAVRLLSSECRGGRGEREVASANNFVLVVKRRTRDQ